MKKKKKRNIEQNRININEICDNSNIDCTKSKSNLCIS